MIFAPELLPGNAGGPAAPPARARARLRGLRPGTVVAAAFLLLLVVAVAWPGLFAADPNSANLVAALQGPSRAHLLGTDQLGRDTFARVVYGARLSLFLGLGATVAAGAVGAAWGLAAGLGGELADEVAMRLADIFLSFPSILTALLVVAILGPGEVNLIVAIAASQAPVFARVVRVQAKLVSQALYVRAAVALGLPRFAVIARHIVPNVLGPLLALLTVNLATALLTGSSLSFLGLGPQPPNPEWGSMLAQARDYLQFDPLLGVFPGVAITVTVIAVSVVGRDLQARFEGRPRT